MSIDLALAGTNSYSELSDPSRGDGASLAGSSPAFPVKHVDVILKVVEQCNLACTYCYFFFGDNQEYKKHPKKISATTVSEVAVFLREGAKQLRLRSIRINFHGGEPTMMKLSEFDEICCIFKEHLAELVTLDFSIQTNATLIGPGWIQLFRKHNVAVGVSLDGPKEYNDIARLDLKGLSSYSKVERGIKSLMSEAATGNIAKPGALLVINPEFDPVLIYQHLIKDLGFDAIDALLPDTPQVQDASKYGRFLTGLFDAWVADANPQVCIRIFRSLFDRLANRGSYLFPMDTSSDGFFALNVASSGELAPDDVIYDIRWPEATVSNTSLSAFAVHPLYEEWRIAAAKIPTDCLSCCWSDICRGGHPWHRYKNDGNGFDRKSIYCEGLKDMYAHVTSFMLEQGFPLENLLRQLSLDSDRVSKEVINA